MTPDQIQNKLNEAVMNIQTLQSELDKLKQHDPNHYIPQPGEVVGIDDYGDDFEPTIFLKYNKGSAQPFECVSHSYEEKYRNGEQYETITWKLCRRLNGEIIEFGCDKPKDYTHLLPAGYEFCEEEDAEDWVKVELMNIEGLPETDIGNMWNLKIGEMENAWRNYYRPIRKIQYHIAVHEAVTVETNPYAVDWSNAPEDAIAHAYDEEGDGNWYIVDVGSFSWLISYEPSRLELPSGLDWTKSKTVRP